MPFKFNPFHYPYIAGNQYAPGPQPYDPGNSHQPWIGNAAGLSMSPQPAMTPVGVINLLIGNPGQPRMRAILPVVNREAPLPFRYLFLSGTVGKSQG